MTPQLQQAIKLLQLNNVELSAFVEDELERNPLLTRADDQESSGDRTSASETEAERYDAPDPLSREDTRARDTVDQVSREGLPGDDDAPLDATYENVYDTDVAVPSSDYASFDATGPIGAGGRSGFDEVEQSIDQRLGETTSLADHLMAQLQIEISDQGERMIGAYLINMLDEAGYLTVDIAEAAEALGCETGEVEAVLARLQQFDPTGVFARDLRECLALQLADRDRLDPAMKALVDNLDLLAAGDIARLKRLCGVDDEDMADMIAELRALDPRPGLQFGFTPPQTVVPDILLKAMPDGAWHVELNSETLPRLLVDNRYHSYISAHVRSKAEKDFINEKFQSANWLIKALDQRARTILRVATEIVRQQDAFFAHGVRHLRPLTLRDIAEAIGMHESTVSRVTANKYMATPRGLLELKYFFTSAIASSTGSQAVSAEAVRDRIRELIENESPDKVLSDDKLVELLRKDGIDIARRTVAKYREAMGIGSSVQRRRAKAALRKTAATRA